MPTISFEDALGLTDPKKKKDSLAWEEALAPTKKVVTFEEAVAPSFASRVMDSISSPAPSLEDISEEPSWSSKIAMTIKKVNEDPLGSLSESVAKIGTKLGMEQSGANSLARDVYHGVQSLGPLGWEFTGGTKFVPKSLPVSKAAPAAAKRTMSFDDAVKPSVPLSGADDFAGNINLNRVAAPEDVKDIYRQTAKQNNEFTDARRGTISFEQTREMAELVGMTPEKLSARIKGQAFNAEQMFAARQFLVGQATKVRDLAKTAQRGSDADRMAFSEELTKLVAAQEQVSGATAEAGRALSQFRMMAGASKEQIARFVDAAKQGGRLDEVIERINTLDDPAQIARFASQAFKAKTSDKLLEVWINSLLSGPQTHATNIMSNSLVSLWSVPERAAAAGVGAFTGSGVRFGEVPAKLFGMLEGLKDGLRAGWRTFRTEEPSDFTSKIEAARYKSIPGPVGRAVRIPGRFLMAQDEVFKAIGYRGEINAQAYRMATNEGLKGPAKAARIAELRANPTEKMQNAARAIGEEQTFTAPLGKGGQAVQMFADAHPWAKVIVPFVRTPVNIVKFAATRSPFAPLFKEVRADLAGANGAIARDTAIAKIGFGSSIAALGGYMAAQGLITGQGPEDPRAKGLMYQSGWQPYSVKIGDTYYSFSRMEPLAMLLGVSADFSELSQYMSEEEVNSVAALILGSVTKNITSKTFLRGLSELVEAVQDPERYGQQYIQSLTGTVVPTGVAQVARTMDPHLREARTVLDNIKSRIPGLRQTLPMKRDLYGEPIKLEGGVGPDILSPIYTSTAQPDPVADELLRLKVYPSRPTRKIKGQDLSPDQYQEIQTITGPLVKMGLGRLISSPKWNELSDDDKKDIIERMMSKLRAAGRKQFMGAQ